MLSKRNTNLLRKASGYTLLEVLFGAVIGGMILITTFTLYAAAITLASRSSAQVATSARGAVITENIGNMARECYSLSLPTDSSGFVVPVVGTSNSSYITTDGSAAALQLTAPATSSVSVVNTAGQTVVAGTGFPMTYTNSAGSPLTIYRSDGSGNPLPNTGQYLWEQGTPPGQTALPTGGERLAILAQTSTIASNTSDAATFARAGSSSTTPAVDIHIITDDYDSSNLNGQTGNEGITSQIEAKCVYLFNHS